MKTDDVSRSGSGPDPVHPRGAAQDLAGRREWTALGICVLAVVLLAVDSTVLSLAVPSLTEALGPSPAQMLWIGDAYAFTLAGFLIPMGSLSDRLGRRRVLLVGAFVFGLASLMAGLAPSSEALIAARALQGVAAATLMPSTLSIIRNIFHDGRQRRKAVTVWAAGATCGAALGPVLGGVLLEHFWWGSVFVINVPIALLIIVLGRWVLPESKDPRPASLDFLGATLSLVTVIAIVYAAKSFALGGAAAVGFASLILGVAAGGLLLHRLRHSPDPFLDISLFRNREFTGAVVVSLLAIFSVFGMIYFFSQYLQLVMGYSELRAGLSMLPFTATAIAAIFLIALLPDWVSGRLLVTAALSTCTVGGLVLLGAEHISSFGGVAAGLALLGLGEGVMFSVITNIIVSAVPRDRAGAAAAISETAYELGHALGIAALGSLLAVVYRTAVIIPPRVPSDVASAARTSLTDARHAALDDPALLAAAQSAFTTAMQYVTLSATVFMALAAALSWWMLPKEDIAADIDTH